MVKTRLIPALSPVQAAEAHRQLTHMTIERALKDALCPVELYCAPDARHPFFSECASQYPIKLKNQNGDDLGVRMHNAFSEALSQYRHAILMGCDCPSLTNRDLEQALSALHEGHDVVLAPAEDGGYVLMGLNSKQPVLFDNMTWGIDQVMDATRRRAKKIGLKIFELEQQWDIDTFEDWERYLTLTRPHE